MTKFLDFDSVRAALSAVQRACFCYRISPGLAQATAQFAQAAKEAKVGVIVNMSQISARSDAKSQAPVSIGKDERVAPECLGLTARLLSRVISGIYHDALAEIGLKVSQYSVLKTIADQEDTRPAALAKSRVNAQPERCTYVCARRARLQPGDGNGAQSSNYSY